MKSSILLPTIVFILSLLSYQTAGSRKVDKVRDKNYLIKTHEASDTKTGKDYIGESDDIGIGRGGTRKKPKDLKAQKVEKAKDKNYNNDGIAKGGNQPRKVEKERDNYYLINTAQGSLKASKRKNGMDYEGLQETEISNGFNWK